MSMGSSSSAAERRLRLVRGGVSPGSIEESLPPRSEAHAVAHPAASEGTDGAHASAPEPSVSAEPSQSLAPAHTPLPGESAPSVRAETAQVEDAELVLKVQAGDRQAFELLYRRHAGFAMNLAIRIQGSASDVEDVVHDAFIKAHQRLNDLRDAAAFRSWLGAIVVRLVRSRLRRRRLMATLGLSHAGDAVDLDAVASGDASPEARAQLAQMYALLQTMPTEDRIAWTLRYVERHRLEAVAQLTDCSLATAKRRIARAQRFFEQHFVSGGSV
ncbi:MAG: sigma-70 family RNA polymerase sigma factor [Polyangiaceae bacterium]